MRRKLLQLSFIALSALFAVSCAKDVTEVDSTPDKPQPVSNDWNFGTSKTVTLSVKASDLQNAPISKRAVSLYSKSPKSANSSDWDSSVSPFSEIQTDANGSFSTSITLESTVDTLYLHIKNISFSDPIAVPVTSSSISLDLHPAGYGIARSAVKSTKAASDPWKYEVSPYFNASSNLWVLGTYNANGYPDYLVGRDTYTSTFLNAISASFPETRDMIINKPELFVDGTTSNLAVTASCNIWVSFLSEGASDNNVVGYFYYPTGSSPATAASIARRIVMFPKVQNVAGGGSLVQGDKVELKYYNGTSWTNVFPAGVTIGWFILNKGYNTTMPASGNIGLSTGIPYYSIPRFNSGDGGYQHNVIFFDKTSQTAVIGFEDRPITASDKDFNDVVFAITANPISAINTSGLPLIVQTTGTDKDGDGVLDVNDKYPDDPQRAYDVYYPTSGTGTLAFEDNWPNQGDYDFNDLVVGYQYHQVTNAYGAIKDVRAAYSVEAVGANYNNGFAVQFGTGPGNVESVSGQVNLAGNKLFDVSSTGYENGQPYAVIPVFPSAHQLFGYTSSTPFINTKVGAVTAAPYPINLNVTFGTPVSTAALGTPPYNAFLVVKQDRGREVHLAGQAPTAKANSALFGTQDDRTNVGSSVFYVNGSSFPWALNIPTEFAYPFENNRIDGAYLHYGTWATSLGASYADWYGNTGAGYRNASRIYKK